MAELSDAIVSIIDGGDVEYTFDGAKILSWVSDTVDEPTQEELQRQRVVSSQDNLDTVIEASVPVEPVGLEDQIAQAQQDGDWQTSANLKADKLRNLTREK